MARGSIVTRRSIGKADNFYRLRVRTVDTSDEVDFEWRDDILYRRPPGAAPREGELILVEAVSLDDDRDAYALGTFSQRPHAYTYLEERQRDLESMTRSQFEDAFFSSGEESDGAAAR